MYTTSTATRTSTVSRQISAHAARPPVAVPATSTTRREARREALVSGSWSTIVSTGLIASNSPTAPSPSTPSRTAATGTTIS